jgi:hypothetical protein
VDSRIAKERSTCDARKATDTAFALPTVAFHADLSWYHSAPPQVHNARTQRPDTTPAKTGTRRELEEQHCAALDAIVVKLNVIEVVIMLLSLLHDKQSPHPLRFLFLTTSIACSTTTPEREKDSNAPITILAKASGRPQRQHRFSAAQSLERSLRLPT